MYMRGYTGHALTRALAVFSAKPYNRGYLSGLTAKRDPLSIIKTNFLNFSLSSNTAALANGTDAVCLHAGSIRAILLRCLGYNNVNLKEAKKLSLFIANIPSYSLKAGFRCKLIAYNFSPTNHIINETTLAKINRLINTKYVIKALKSKYLGGLALNIYKGKGALFYNNYSGDIIDDNLLIRLITFHNIVIYRHQAFFTKEALMEIAKCIL
ncbi:uncharacterized protein K441DRAFT_690799 [Cenococcum geophilum 1.58]|uniref:Uncharacterized protein n=1 Tax=Cenococcum geophilum 1.58 TaxID=794803 RepID=A0ACC8EPG8_9PEZI|nr:hypothetical protein K441DRAFT_690799 [Cenococcum geophilum 1.58]